MTDQEILETAMAQGLVATRVKYPYSDKIQERESNPNAVWVATAHDPKSMARCYYAGCFQDGQLVALESEDGRCGGVIAEAGEDKHPEFRITAKQIGYLADRAPTLHAFINTVLPGYPWPVLPTLEISSKNATEISVKPGRLIFKTRMQIGMGQKVTMDGVEYQVMTYKTPFGLDKTEVRVIAATDPKSWDVEEMFSL